MQYSVLSISNAVLSQNIRNCYGYFHGTVTFLHFRILVWCFDVLVFFNLKIQSMEAEIMRLNNLRDRASEKGHKKEYPFLRQYILIVTYLPTSALMPQFGKLRHHLIFMNCHFVYSLVGEH